MSAFDVSIFPEQWIMKKNIKKKLLAIAVGLIMVNPAVVLGKRAWLHFSGGVIANSSRIHRYMDKPFRILSVKGQKWARWNKLEDASAYHALVVLPLVVPDGSGGLSGGDEFTHTNIETWQPWKGQSISGPTEERQLAVVYDAIWQTVTVDSQKYHLANGNLFLIRFDENWQSEVKQLKATVNNDAGVADVVNAFKSLLKEDKNIQQL
jgi:hypothetical protein